MSSTEAMQIAVLADDLSGAAESAATALLRTTRIRVELSAQPVDALDARVLVLDSDTRATSPDHCAEVMARLAPGLAASDLVVVKVDSLLRGNLSTTVATLATTLDRTPVIATALPALGRTVVGGIPLIAGTPLHQTDLWQVESAAPPRSVADALAPLPTVNVPISVVRSDTLDAALREATEKGLAPICDGETTDDLTAVAAAAQRCWPQPLLVGSAGLVRAVATMLEPEDQPIDPDLPRVDCVLAVVGSRAPGIAEQLDAARAAGASVHLVDPEALLAGAAEVAPIVRLGLQVLALDPLSTARPDRGAALAGAWADLVAPLARDFPAVLLTGGETARAVLDRWRTRTLHPIAELAPGSVLSRTDDDRLVVTRPGSFGGPDGLALLTRLLDPVPTTQENP